MVETGGVVSDVLGALDSDACRCILEESSDDALSASEISERCDLPLSTTYRKLELLTDTGLVDERTRVRPSGKHANEYVRAVESVVVSLGDDGAVRVQIVHRRASERPSTVATESRAD